MKSVIFQKSSVVGIGSLMLVVFGVVSVVPAAGELNRFSWKGPGGEAGILRIENSFGDVRLRNGGNDGEIEVAAVMQQLRSDGVHLETRIEVRDGVLFVTVGWASKPGLEIPFRPEGDLSRADLAVLVPRGLKTFVDAPNGLVETRGVHGDLELQTDRGGIRIHRHFGAVSASTDSGSIEAVLLTGETDEPQVFESLTGSVEIWVGADADNLAILSTSGAITTDFSVEILHHDDEEPDKVGRAVLGGGGPEIRLRSLRGPLILRRVAVVRQSAKKVKG